MEYEIEYAALCRQEGQVLKWRGSTTALELEWELKFISGKLLGQNVFGATSYYFEHFSEGQRRLLMYLLQEMSGQWIRRRRRSSAIKKLFRK
jgi:hypothetical protein